MTVSNVHGIFIIAMSHGQIICIDDLKLIHLFTGDIVQTQLVQENSTTLELEFRIV